MANPAKRKGDRGEREACALLSDLTGYNVKRALGAGRKEDVGDGFGLPNAVVQIADWKDALRAVREKPLEAEKQRERAAFLHAALDERFDGGPDFAVTMVRLRGGVWRFVQTPEQWVKLYNEAMV